MFVHFFLDETGAFLDFSFDAHFGLTLLFALATVTRAEQTTRRALFCSTEPDGPLTPTFSSNEPLRFAGGS